MKKNRHEHSLASVPALVPALIKTVTEGKKHLRRRKKGTLQKTLLAEVWSAWFFSDLPPRPVIVKESRKSHLLLEDPDNEAEMYEFLKDKNICPKLLARYASEDRRLAIFEEGSSDLLDVMSGPQLKAKLRLRWFCEIVEKVAFLHECELAHLDLSPENILIMHDGSVRLIDFGMAGFFPGGNDWINCGSQKRYDGRTLGKMNYALPDIMKGKAFRATRADGYSLGVIGHVIATGHGLYNEPGDACYQNLQDWLARSNLNALVKAQRRAFPNRLLEEKDPQDNVFVETILEVSDTLLRGTKTTREAAKELREMYARLCAQTK
jgi:serine/threonine protein kinase